MIRPFSIILLLGALLVDAAPISLQPRQDVSIQALDEPLTAPRTFQTVSQTQTNAGMVTLTCQVTQTPIQDPAGQQQNLVREEKSCMITVQGGSGGGQAPIDQPSGTQTTIVTATPGTGDGGNNGGGGGGQQTTAPPQASGSTAVIPPTSTSTAMTGTMVGSGVATGPISTDSGTPTSSAAATSGGGTSSAASPTSSAGAGGNGNNNGNNNGNGGNNGNNNGGGAQADVSAIGASSVAASALPTAPSNGAPVNGTAAAAESSATPAPFELPGRQIAVLPIGLGVFAGISVIALIVVGLVTYERTKYRKAFRQRKLAESGAGMGYGGMAERA
jgi:hypothetical protein